MIRIDGKSDVDSPLDEEKTENSSIILNDEHLEEKNDLSILAQSNSEMYSFISKPLQSNEETEIRFFVLE